MVEVSGSSLLITSMLSAKKEVCQLKMKSEGGAGSLRRKKRQHSYKRVGENELRRKYFRIARQHQKYPFGVCCHKFKMKLSMVVCFSFSCVELLGCGHCGRE